MTNLEALEQLKKVNKELYAGIPAQEKFIEAQLNKEFKKIGEQEAFINAMILNDQVSLQVV